MYPIANVQTLADTFYILKLLSVGKSVGQIIAQIMPSDNRQEPILTKVNFYEQYVAKNNICNCNILAVNISAECDNLERHDYIEDVYI